jgi:putative RecB family exonuclease
MALETLSPSRAGDFKTCPRLYKFRSIERVPEPITIHQARGTTAHLALQRLFDVPAPRRTPERLADLFRAAWSELRLGGDHRDLFESVEAERRWGIQCMTLLANYFSVEDPRTFEPIHRELDMLEDFDGVVVRGILDRIDRRPDGRLVITDYKTGLVRPERHALPAFFALKVYALLIRRRLGETPAEVRLLYLGGPTLQSLSVDDRHLDGIERQIRALWQTIERAIAGDHFPPRPGRACGWCAFRPVCPAFASELRAG